MALIVALSADVPTIQTWRPLYLILTVIIVCSQKVDTTLSKGVLRFVASVVGGAYGKLGCCPGLPLQMCISWDCTLSKELLWSVTGRAPLQCFGFLRSTGCANLALWQYCHTHLQRQHHRQSFSL